MILDFLNERNFKHILEYNSKQQKRLYNCVGLTINDTDLTIYAKVVDQLIEFSDQQNEHLWTTHFCIASIIILNNQNELFDKFVVPVYLYRIRNTYELTKLNEIYEDLENELTEFDQFIPEEPIAYA